MINIDDKKKLCNEHVSYEWHAFQRSHRNRIKYLVYLLPEV